MNRCLFVRFSPSGNLPAISALVADGCYQDSWCAPEAWPYGLFPTYRNVLWSCNWHPVTHYEWTRHGVEVFGVPAVVTDGWGDDRYLRDYPLEVQRGLQGLFAHGRHGSRVRWLEGDDSRLPLGVGKGVVDTHT